MIRVRAASSLRCGRLGDKGECAARKPVVPVLVQRQHLHRNVARGRILLQVVEHRPAQHVGQEDIERDGRGMELARQRPGLGAAHGHQHLEALVARQIAQNARIMRIVFDNQQHGISGLQIVAIVGNMFRRTLCDRRRSQLTGCRDGRGGALANDWSTGRPHIGLRQDRE